MPLHRRVRLKNIEKSTSNTNQYLTQEIQRATRRITENGSVIETAEQLKARWARLLYTSNDGRALSESKKVPSQHQWVTEGTRFLSGKDFINMIRIRVNAMPTKSRTSRGRGADRSCRAGCQAVETLNHVLQHCHRTHRARIERHNAIVSYVKRGLVKKYVTVEEEPRFSTTQGIRKPDLIAIKGSNALLIDAQVVGENVNLCSAHKNKIEKYKPLEVAIKSRYAVETVSFSSVTLSYRGVWSVSSYQQLKEKGIITRSDIKILSTRVLLGGLSGFWRFNRTTTSSAGSNTCRRGIG